MPKRYTVQDSLSGKTITFDWHEDTPPTEADMAEISNAADTAHLGTAVQDAAKMGVLQDTHAQNGGWLGNLPQQPFKDVRAFDKPIPPSLTQDIVRMGTRIAPAAAGSYYGGMAGAPFGPAGMAVGAAVGGFAGAFGGEAGGQYLENQPGDGQTRTEYNPKEMVLQGALGALPLPVKTASTLTRAALAHAAQGAVLGGSNAALSPLMEGQTPSLQDVLSNAGIGAVMGGVTGGGLHWLHQPVAAAAPQATPTPPPAAFDPSRPSMATPTATPMGGGMPSGTESAMPGSVPVRGVPPPFVTEPVVNTVPTPEPRTPLAWALKPSEASSAGSWSGPVPGGMTQGMNGSWNWAPGHQGGTSTSMEIPLQDFEAAGAPDRRASMGRGGLPPEPPPPGPTTPPVGFGGGLPPGDPSVGPTGPAGPQAPPEPTYAPGEDNTLSGLRNLLKQAVAANDQASAQKIAAEINRRQYAQRGMATTRMATTLTGAAAGAAGGAAADPDDPWAGAIAGGLAGGLAGHYAPGLLEKGLGRPIPTGEPAMAERAPLREEGPIPGSMAEFAPTNTVGATPHATGPEPYERTPLVQGQTLPGGVSAPHDVQEMANPVQGKVIKTTGLKTDTEAMGRVLGQSLYAQPQPFVAVKELVQNAADAVRGQKGGKVEVHTNRGHGGAGGGPFVEVRDNGKGMTLQELEDYFLTMGGSGKRDDASASGGFGVASTSPLLGGERIELRTTTKGKNGQLSTIAFTGTPDEILGQKLQIVQADTPDPQTGTHIRVYYPSDVSLNQYEIDNFLDRAGQGTAMPTLVSSERKIVGAPIETKYNGLHTPDHLRPIANKPKFDTFGKARTYVVPGAEIDVHDEPIVGDKQFAVKAGVYNNGGYQFDTSLSHGMGFNMIPDLPSRAHINIRPTVAEGTPNYPFTANRENFSTSYDTAQGGVLKNHFKPYIDAYLGKLDKATSNGPTLEGTKVRLFDAGDRITPQDVTRLSAIPGMGAMATRLTSVMQRVIGHLYPAEEKQVTHVGLLFSGENNGGVRVRNGIGPDAPMGVYLNPHSPMMILGDNPSPKDVANGLYHIMLHETTHIEHANEGAGFTWGLFKNDTRVGLQQKNWWIESIRKAISDPNNPDQLSAAFRDSRAINQDIGGRPSGGAAPHVEGMDHLAGSAALPGGEGGGAEAAGPGGGDGGAASPVQGPDPTTAPGAGRGGSEAGFANPALLTRLTGGVVGGLGGAAAAGPDATPEERIAAGLAGAAGGALLGHGLTRALGAGAKLPEGSGIPELTAQREAQAAGAKPLQKPPLTDRIRTNMLDALDPVRVGLRDMEDKTGVKPTTDKGWENIYNIRGGQGGKVAVLKDRYQKVADDAKTAKLQGWLTEHLNLIGMESSLTTLGEKARKLAAEGDLKGANAIWDDMRNGKALPNLAGTKMNEQTVANTRAEWERRAGAKLPEIQRLGKAVTDLQRESLQTAMDAGLIRPEVGKALLKRGDYIPMSRIMDAVAEQSKFARGSSMQLKQQGVLFNLEGSERMNKDPLRAAYGRHAEIIYEAGRNEVAQNVASWRDLGQEWKDTFRDISRGGAPKRGEVAIGYYDKGERKTLAVPQALGTALMVANSTDIDGVFKAMGGFNQLLRNMAITMSPAFGVRNAIKDNSDTRILAKGMGRYNPVDFAKYVGEWTGSLKDTWTHDAKWQEMMNNRAGYGTLARQFGDEALMAEPTKNPLTLIKNAAGHIGNTIEENTKSVGYQRLKAKGMSPTDAAFETRRNIGSPDFARKGAFGARMGVLQTFFNASLQGINRTVSALSDPKVLAPVLAGATLTALARDSWNRQFTDSDGTPTLDRVSDSDRRNYYVLVNPYAAQYEKDGVKRYQIAKVAKGHAAQLITTPIEGLIDAFHGKGKGMAQLAADTASNLLPGNTQLDAKHIGQSFINGQIGAANPALKAAVAQFANKDFAFGQPVVPKRLEDASAPQQWDERTSPTVVKATQFADNHLGMNLSPVRMQQGLRDLGLMSGPGEMALSLADKAVGSPASKKQPVGPDALLQTPVIGPVARAFVGSTFDQKSRDQEEAFYEALDAGKTAIRDKNLALESPERRGGLKDFQIDPSTGRPANVDRLVALATSSAMIKASQDLSKIRQASRLAQQSGADPAILSRLAQAEQKVIAGALATVTQVRDRLTRK